MRSDTAETLTDMSFRVVTGCVGGAIAGILAILLLAPQIRSLKTSSIDAGLCRSLWERFDKTTDLIELERNKFLLDRVHCDVGDILARARFKP